MAVKEAELLGLKQNKKLFGFIRQRTKDLSPWWESISSSFYRGNKSIFELRGPGKFADLKGRTKKTKRSRLGFIYPILRSSGDLEDSITNENSTNALKKVTPLNLQLGTKLNYALLLQEGTKYMKPRPFISLEVVKGRKEAWNRILKNAFEKDIKDNVYKA